MELQQNLTSHDEFTTQIYEFSGHKVDSDSSADLWSCIQQHKWVLSEKIGRDVGLKVAAVDYIENILAVDNAKHDAQQVNNLKRMGAQILDRSVWDTISESQPPKQIVDKQIVLPLTHYELAKKHGVTIPRTIIFFGPPGTGKTHFARAIAARLQWWYIEVSPSDLLTEGEDRMGHKLKSLFKKSRNMEEAVIFIDEFEEIGGKRDNASRTDKSITTETFKEIILECQPSLTTENIRELEKDSEIFTRY